MLLITNNCLVLFTMMFGYLSGNIKTECLDRVSQIVEENEAFQPTSDPCYTCMCEYGQAVECASENCILPKCRPFILKEDECCDYLCVVRNSSGVFFHEPEEFEPDTDPDETNIEAIKRWAKTLKGAIGSLFD